MKYTSIKLESIKFVLEQIGLKMMKKKTEIFLNSWKKLEKNKEANHIEVWKITWESFKQMTKI